MENIEIIRHTFTLELFTTHEVDSFSNEFIRVSCVPLFRNKWRTRVRIEANSCTRAEALALVMARAKQVEEERADCEGALQEAELG